MQVVQALEPYTGRAFSVANREAGSSLVATSDSKSPPISQQPPQANTAIVVSHHGAEPIPALVKTIAVLHGAEATPVAPTETGSGANADETTALPHGQGTDYEPSDPDFPLFLDLGPEPSLSEGLSRPKPRSAVDQSASPTSTATLAKRLTSRCLWGSAALTTTTVVIVGLLTVIKLFSTAPGQSGIGLRLSPAPKAKPKIKADSLKSSPDSEPPIIVRTEDREQTAFPAQQLVEALQTAMGTHGWVELRNREPLRLTGYQPLNFGSGRGRLIIRAAPGFQPVIEVDLNRSQAIVNDWLRRIAGTIRTDH